jgi:hypothetical protein
MEPGSDMSKAVNLAKVRVDGIVSLSGRCGRTDRRGVEAAPAPSASACSAISRAQAQGTQRADPRGNPRPGQHQRDQRPRRARLRDLHRAVGRAHASLRPQLRRVVSAIQARSRDLPGGLLRTDSGAITLRSTSQAYAGREFEQLTLISRDDGTRIRVGDVATVRDGFAEQPVLSLVDGKPALTFAIERVGDQNVLEITSLVRDYVERKQAELPEG